MSAYTNIKIEMENNEVAMKATEKAKSVIMKNNNKENVSRFVNEIVVSEGRIIVNDSFSLSSDEYNNLLPIIFKAIATLDEVKSFEATSYHVSCSCGYESHIKASYWNETLTIESIEGEDFYGYCDECGEFVINYEECEPNKVYRCKDCGKVLTVKDLFPKGLPEAKVECYDIW